MRSPKFLQADGGFSRIVWLPREIKESLENYIPEEIRDKIPTDAEANSINEIKTFLQENEHPILERLSIEEEISEVPVEEEEEEEYSQTDMEAVPIAPVAYAPELSMPTSGGMKIIFKNAKIYAEKVIIKRK
jgi:acetyl-CoA decarbonylase/synthase complex subunit beta